MGNQENIESSRKSISLLFILINKGLTTIKSIKVILIKKCSSGKK